jgi:hypothetical protein
MFDRFEPANNIKIPSTCHLPHREQSHPQQANKTLDRNGYRRSVSFDVQLKDDYPILKFLLEIKFFGDTERGVSFLIRSPPLHEATTDKSAFARG